MHWNKSRALVVWWVWLIWGAAASNTLTQGVEIAVGLKDRFDWTRVAVAGVMGMVGAKLSSMLPGAAVGEQPATWDNTLISGTAWGSFKNFKWCSAAYR